MPATTMASVPTRAIVFVTKVGSQRVAVNSAPKAARMPIYLANTVIVWRSVANYNVCAKMDGLAHFVTKRVVPTRLPSTSHVRVMGLVRTTRKITYSACVTFCTKENFASTYVPRRTKSRARGMAYVAWTTAKRHARVVKAGHPTTVHVPQQQRVRATGRVFPMAVVIVLT